MPSPAAVEHRVLGPDHRTITPAVERGTSLVIGNDALIVSPAGWDVTDRTALDAGSLELHRSGIIVNANVGPLTGELDDLLAYADGEGQAPWHGHDQ